MFTQLYQSQTGEMLNGIGYPSKKGQAVLYRETKLFNKEKSKYFS